MNQQHLNPPLLNTQTSKTKQCIKHDIFKTLYPLYIIIQQKKPIHTLNCSHNSIKQFFFYRFLLLIKKKIKEILIALKKGGLFVQTLKQLNNNLIEMNRRNVLLGSHFF